jgi:adenosylhomocysteine nucleosidase
MTTQKPLLVFAMQEESQDVFSDYDLLHTGIGKINAAYGLTRTLYQARPSLVINMGTAGSRKHAGGTIVNPASFVQRDMDVTALGFEKFQTPFSDDPVHIEYGLRIDGLPGGVCGSGDSFDASEGAAAFDVVDMEAYALALICQREDIPFLCLKYVSDGADGEAAMDWQTALHVTAEKLREALKNAGY